MSNRRLPWLQDTADVHVWGLWEAAWRDVRIVDSQGRLVSVYNLFEHDLSSAANRAALKELFLSAAKTLDSDNDHLSDDWEVRYFGNLLASPSADSDRDGHNNFSEFALGSNPLDPKSRPLIVLKTRTTGQQSLFDVTVHRRAGFFLDYVAQEASELGVFLGSGLNTMAAPETRNLFDGSGTLETVYSISAGNPQKFIKVRALPRQGSSTGSGSGGPRR